VASIAESGEGAEKSGAADREKSAFADAGSPAILMTAPQT
jgi:hypothetical protein